jgi:phosphatidylglycerophosphate synthase
VTRAESLRVWIDAASARSETRVFGLTLVEHLLHALRNAKLALADVRIDRPGGAPAELDPALAQALPLRWCDPADLGFAARVGAALEAAGGAPVLLLDGGAVLDSRLLVCFAGLSGPRAFRSPSAREDAALLRLEGRPPEAAGLGHDLASFAGRLIESGTVKELAPGEFDTYLVNLRRHVDPYLFPIRDEAERARVERFLFDANYKGSTDFLTKWVYPPLVWRMVRPLADWRVHPNWVTAVSIAATFAAIPLFAMGAWVPGLALAYLMSVLDSVDGKLARLTHTHSKLGEILDHGLDIVHPPLWYLAWGYTLGAGTTGSVPFVASLWMFAVYAVDRALAGLFRWRTGVSIHAATPLDERLRTWLSRRNPNLAFITLALVADAVSPRLGAARFTFYGIVAWQVACFAWHAARLAQYWNMRLRPQPTRASACRARGSD